jgi:hypothetical protein
LYRYNKARQELFGSESEETASSHHNLGGALDATGNSEAAAEAFADALAVRRRLGRVALTPGCQIGYIDTSCHQLVF